MKKQVTLLNGNTITVRDDIHVSPNEIVYVELKDNKYTLAIMEYMQGRPHKKIWKIVKKRNPVSLVINWLLWNFVNIFFKKTLMNQRFKINTGILKEEDSFYKYKNNLK